MKENYLLKKWIWVFLVSGIIAPLLYIGSDIFAGLIWEGYNFFSQAVSELRGLGAPTRAFLIPILFLYALTEIIFGIGIWLVSDSRRIIKFLGGLMISLGILDLMGPFFAMDASQEVGSMRNIIHILVTILTLVFILLIIGFGAFVSGKRFRLYSFITLLTVVVAGGLTFLELQKVEAGLPTPWMGFKERINIYGYMIWMGVMAITLIRSKYLPSRR